MGALEEVIKLKNQGFEEDQIINNLQGRFSPREINDALSQAHIKSAISEDTNYQATQNPPVPQAMQEEDFYTPRAQETPYQEQDVYTPYQQAYSQQDYYQDPYSNSPSSAGSYTDTMIEVAGQVFSEKIKKIQDKVEDLDEFKNIAQTEIENFSERLKKIESVFDQLQAAILHKIGSYGDNIEGIKKEMSMMQDSFRKIAEGPLSRQTKKNSKNR